MNYEAPSHETFFIILLLPFLQVHSFGILVSKPLNLYEIRGFHNTKRLKCGLLGYDTMKYCSIRVTIILKEPAASSSG
jgi:hypothetical protein